MRRATTVAIMFSFAVLALLITSAAAFAGTATIDGHVNLAANNITVMLSRLDPSSPTGWTYLGSALTGDQTAPGYFCFQGLDAGTYTLQYFDYSGRYAQQYWNGKPGLTSADAINLTDGETFVADAQLADAGRISGTVTDPLGLPLAGITVWSRSLVPGDECRGATTTASDGSYNVGGMDTGSCSVSLEDFSRTYLYQIYDGQPVWGTPTPISVTSGQTIALGVTVLHKAATIGGKITTHLGLPVADVVATAYTYHAGKLTEVSGGANCATTGTYRIGQLPAGRYIIGFFWDAMEQAGQPKPATLFYPDTFDPACATVVTVSEGQHVGGYDSTAWGDKTPPTTQAVACSARAGTEPAVRFRVLDSGKHGPSAEVTIVVKTRAGKVVRTFRLRWRPVNRWQTAKLLCKFKHGSYRFYVYAVDSGGNRQSKLSKSTLLIR